ncbi:hypothetical protein QE152_g27751 [Popillia japonica]|uniref:Uncharacterized protein n=1 Tax=Popillia japonica TaxID=7064 RepID=A0AAW1JLC3_POPJA
MEEEVEEDSNEDVGELAVDVAESGEELVAKSGLKWLSKPKPPTQRYQRNIVTAKSGPTDYVQNAVTLKDYFDLLITDDIKGQNCTHTNEEAEPVTLKDYFDLLITDDIKGQNCTHTNEEAERDITTSNSAHPNSLR